MRISGLSLIILILSLNLTIKLYAQEVSIANLSSAKGFFGDKIEISGSGFSTTVANMEVWFGAAKGTVVESRENILIATVPAGATTSTVTVLNKTNNLSASSSQIFFPVFNGDPAADLSITDPYTFANTNEVFDLQMADLDNDGNNDIVSTKRDAASTTIQIYRNTTNGSNISFAESTVSIGVPSLKVAIGDIDNDGKLDLVVTQENDYTLFVLRNNSTVGSIAFAAAKSYFLRTSQKINGVCVRDLDLDGKPEVIVSNTQDNEVSIFKNSSTPGVINLSFTPTRIATGGTKAYDLIAEDLNNDGKAEIIVVQSEANIYILPNRSSTGTLEFGSAIVVPANLNLTSIEAGDINDDGLPDLVGSDVLDQRFALLINQSSGDQITFGPASITDISFRCFGVALADYTGNGQLDIIAASAGGSELVIIKNESENGSLSLTPDVIPQPSGSFYIVSGDLSDDGKPDIAFTSKDATLTNFYLVALRNTICNSPEIDSDGVASICNGQTYTFTTPALPNTSYLWKKDGVEVQNSTDPFYVANTAGDYTVTAVNGACSIESAAVTLASSAGTIPNDPVASNNGPTCVGGDITLQSTAVVGATYEWTGPGGFTSTAQNPTISDMRPEKAGTYYVKAIISPCESNVSETIVEVINPPDLSVSKAIDGKVCEGETNTLTVGLAAGYTYQWYKDGAPITGATGNSYGATQPGSYYVNLQGVANNCDLSSDVIVIEMFSPPVPVITASGPFCQGLAITFSETTTLEPNKTPTFAWDFGDGTTSTEQSPTHTYADQATPTDYIVELVIGYEGHTCKSDPVNYVVTVEQPTAFSIDITGDVPFCDIDSVQLSVVTTGFQSVTWSTGESGFSIYGKEAGTITATALNDAGCESTAQVVLTTNAGPDVTASADVEIVNLGESVQLTATGADTYLWSPPETLDDPTSATPLATPTETTLYMVTGTGSNNCSSMAEVTVEVRDTGNKLPIEAPKMFSPNNDGVNDTWVIGNIQNFPDCELVIFTRSGKLVFETRGYNNDWDGRDANSNELPQGAYFYTISCPDGKNASGSVSIIR